MKSDMEKLKEKQRRKRKKRTIRILIAAGIGIDVGDGVFSFRKEKIANAVTTSYPYVKSVDLSYSLPGTVELILHEATVAMAVPCTDGILLLDDEF